MCLILFAYKTDPDYHLQLLANRDEFYARPAALADWWEDAPQLLAGRDLERGGSWLGVTRQGRFAALTNYRDRVERDHSSGRSRGALVRDYLLGSLGPADYLNRVAEDGGAYNGFNLLAGDQQQLCYYSNRQGQIRSLEPGLYGLSNSLLDTPWPKVLRGKSALGSALLRSAGEEELLRLLTDREPVADRELPDTGFGIEWERLLAPLFIAGERYGTRCSTLVKIGHDGRILLRERSFSGAERENWRDQRWEFDLEDENFG